ncbi:Transcriptional regulator [Candidatus Burkholderia verschuerenii]|uniref:Transcriptional regulator n=1 Tax=Candidatus Burkholderia verschuerenii TaxID=242163 RepID=A0A0L0MFQ7_9BURK|nr:winged helix-turn-helix domain-containing protein [Candidatus Burkholderia verschuerenii]KND61532.1 Transcriptional regulator [Candidatus Burkholderia verschuerenii]
MKEQETMLAAAERITLFGRFALQRATRTLTLTLDGRPVPINDRAMDVLIALVDARGRIVPVGELQHGSSPSSSVVANNSVQALVSQLRRALGEDRDLIETVPRRGYRLATEWYEIRDALASSSNDTRPPDAPHVPASTHSHESTAQAPERTPLIGRDAELSELLMRIPQHRLVTLMGARGVGKTRLAKEAAHRTSPLFDGRVHWVDLGAHVTSEGIVLPHAQTALVVIDHADHLAHDIAPVIDALIARTQANVIVCAEGPLFISGEYLLPIAPLRFATTHRHDDTTESDAYRLFLSELPVLADASPVHATIESICRALSGNPLAISLAARQIGAAASYRASLHDVLIDWEQRFNVVQIRRDNRVHAVDAVRSVVAFAFHALDDATRVTVRRLSLFAGSFSWPDARLVPSTDDDATIQTAIDAGCIAEADDDHLDIAPAMREFALALLAQHADYAPAAARHAQSIVDRLTRQVTMRTSIADVRRALAWSIDTGRIDLAARLLQASITLWSDASLSSEHLHWITRAIDHPDTRAMLKVRDHMLLSLALAQGRQRMRPEHSPTDTVAAWWRVYDLATACADDDMRLAALTVLLLRTLQSGYGDDRPDLLAPVRERIALECEGSSSHPGFSLMRGVLMTLDGRHEDAIAELAPRAHDAHSIEADDDDTPRAPRYIEAVSHNALAISLWLSGARTPSHPVLLQALTDARQQSDPVSRCAASALACVLFLLEENTARIAQQARMVCAISQQHGLAAWEPVGRSFLRWTEAAEGSHDAARQLTDGALVNIERRHATLIDLLVLERYVELALSEVGSAALLRLYDGMVEGLESSGRR